MSTDVTLNLSKISQRFRLQAFKKINISHLLLLLLALHLFAATQPSDGGMIFDEAHYVKASIATLNGEAANIEHTPLTKIIMALSISLLGDYWFGWRLPAIICAVAAIYVFYRIASRYMSPTKALVASAFLGFDTLFFVNTGIALLDPPAVLFALIGIERFLTKDYRWSAVAFAVAFLCKEVTFLVVVGVVAFHIARTLMSSKRQTILSKHNFKLTTVVIGIFALVSLGGLYVYDIVYQPTMGGSVISNVLPTVYVGNQTNPDLPDFNVTIPVTTITTTSIYTNLTGATVISNPIQHLQFAFGYFKGLVPTIQTTGADYRPPWGWILPVENTFNPPQYLGVSVTIDGVNKPTIAWQSAINPAVEFMYIPIVAICGYCILQRKNTEWALLTLMLMLANFVPWLWLGAFVQRMTFNYYFLYTVPAICLGIPLFWDALPIKQQYKIFGISLQFITAMAVFMYYFPIVLFR